MSKEVLQSAKKYNFLEKLEVGMYVDAIDQSKWKVARIQSFRDYGHRHTVHLHFDGYPVNWDQDFDLPASNKMAPFRKFTLPYTGPNPPHRSIYRAPASLDFEASLQVLRKINKEDKNNIKPELIIQQFRGTVFIHVDTLLSQSIRIKPEEQEEVIKFLEVYVDVGVNLMKFFIDKISEISKQNITEPNVIYVNSIYALLSSLPEVLYSFNSMVTQKDRRIKFFDINNNQNARKRLKKLLMSKDIVKICSAILQFQNPPFRGFSWAIKKEVLVLLAGLQETIQFPKIIDNRQILQALEILGYLQFKQAFSSQFIENTRIQLVMNLFLSGNFQGKLRALSEFKKLFDLCGFSRKSLMREKILTPNFLLILTDNSTFNSEIFKRSFPLFQEAAKADLLTNQILQRILNLQRDKHELQLKLFYSTLAEFGEILINQQPNQFFQAIKSYPLDSFQINLIKQFTHKVIGFNTAYRCRQVQNNYQFGLPYLWQIIKQNKNQEITNAAIQAFSSLANESYYRKIMQNYFAQCFNNISSGKNVQNSLKIIQNSIGKNRDLVTLIDKIDKQYGVIDLVIKSLINSTSISSKTIQSSFKFLEQINQFAKKKISVQHIQSLWKLKQCRKSILNFMRKFQKSRLEQKSTDRITNKKLQISEIKQIITKIFQNQNLMDNYTQIQQDAYKTIDELLLAYNLRTGAIQYTYKHSIKTIDPAKLFGLQLYLLIVTNCQDENIVNTALKRYVQFFLRPYSKNTIQSKASLWNFCAQKLTKHLQNSTKKYDGYFCLLSEIKGRMQSMTMTDPSPVTFSVINKGTEIKKIITLPRSASLWKMRQVISQQFNLQNNNFLIHIKHRKKTLDMQFQEEFSVTFIDASNRDPQQISIIIEQSKQLHPHFLAIKQFKNAFSSNYAQKIYESLSTIKNQKEQYTALNILSDIPHIRSLQQKFKALQIGKNFNWNNILDPDCRAKLQYQLSVITFIKNPKWIIDFNQKGGIQQIQKILRERVNSNFAYSVQDYGVFIKLMQFLNESLKFAKMSKILISPISENSFIDFIRLNLKQKDDNLLLNNSTFLDYFQLSFIALETLLDNFQSNLDFKKIVTNQYVFQTLQLLLFTPIVTNYQDRLTKTVLKIYQKSKSRENLCKFVQKYLDSLFKNQNARYSCQIYFNLILLMFDTNCVTEEFFNNAKKFIKSVRFGPPNIYFQNQNQTNHLIYGWLRITKCLVLKNLQAKEAKVNLLPLPESDQKFAQFLIADGLFNQGHLFNSEKTRGQAFDILTNLSCTKQSMSKINQQIAPILQKASWRKQNEWHLKSYKTREKNTKVGLKNLAATCYINSLIQQLYNIKQFREPLLSLQLNSIQTNQNVAFQLQKIFAFLKMTTKQVYSTESFCQNFIIQGQPIDPRIQMDVDEFFHTLFDKMQQNLIKIKKQSIIDDVFKGEYSNLIIGQQCQHKSQRIQHFMSMRLQIINKSSLIQALNQFIKGEVLEGQNAYFCEKCDKKIKAIKRVCVKSLPQVLILTLKRFQFDFDRMEKFKLNSFCEFGEQLDMAPYMRETLYENQQKLDPSQYKYKLKGVIIHYGISEAGHYTSYIQVENNEWKYFDDDKISNFDFKQLGKESFGGIDENPYTDSNEKIKNAYVLIYEKIKKNPIQNFEVNNFIKEQVNQSNLNSQKIKILFDSGLQHFFDQNSQNLQKLYFLYVHLVSLRSQNRQNYLQKCFEKCIEILQKNPQLIQWYLTNFSEGMIKQFLILGHSEANFFVASILVYCVKRHFDANFMRRCIKCIDKKNMVALNKIFQAASYVPHYGKLLAEYSFPDKIIKIIKQDKCTAISSALANMPDITSEFGQACLFTHEKKDHRNSIELICCIQHFKLKGIVIQDVDAMLKRTKKLSNMCSLATFFTNRFKDEENFNLLISSIGQVLIEIQFKPQDEYIFKSCIILVWKLSEYKDEVQKKRNAKLAEIYLQAILKSLEGYKAMKMLIQGLFSICFNNRAFHEQFLILISQKQNKKYAKLIKQWMKQSQKVVQNLRSDKWSYFRRQSRMAYSLLQKIQSEKKVKSEDYLNLFNSLIEGHNLNFKNLFSPEIEIGESVSLNEFEQYQYQVESKFGLILKIKNEQGNVKYVLQDDMYPQRYISILKK